MRNIIHVTIEIHHQHLGRASAHRRLHEDGLEDVVRARRRCWVGVRPRPSVYVIRDDGHLVANILAAQRAPSVGNAPSQFLVVWFYGDVGAMPAESGGDAGSMSSSLGAERSDVDAPVELTEVHLHGVSLLVAHRVLLQVDDVRIKICYVLLVGLQARDVQDEDRGALISSGVLQARAWVGSFPVPPFANVPCASFVNVVVRMASPFGKALQSTVWGDRLGVAGKWRLPRVFVFGR